MAGCLLLMEVSDLLSHFPAVSLQALDERASLLRRVDHKYVVPRDAFEELARSLENDHQALEIDGRRWFRYRSTYFETSDLRCFVDHVADRLPRFKARSRCYEDSGTCVFEVKIKRSEEETDKRQIDYAQADRDQLTAEAQECLRSALDSAGIQTPDELGASLTTAFERVTFASCESPDRLTCDFNVRLIGPDGEAAAMREGLVLLETKSAEGNSPADRELARMELEPISLSKYRVGMSAVGGARRFGAQPGSDFFQT